MYSGRKGAEGSVGEKIRSSERQRVSEEEEQKGS